MKEHRDDTGRDPIVLHRHQRDAVEAARTGGSYVLTTGTVFARSGAPGQARTDMNLSGLSAFGKYLRGPQVFGHTLKPDDALQIIAGLLAKLCEVGLLTEVVADGAGRPGYRLKASAIRWTLGDGTQGAEDRTGSPLANSGFE